MNTAVPAEPTSGETPRTCAVLLTSGSHSAAGLTKDPVRRNMPWRTSDNDQLISRSGTGGMLPEFSLWNSSRSGSPQPPEKTGS